MTELVPTWQLINSYYGTSDTSQYLIHLITQTPSQSKYTDIK